MSESEYNEKWTKVVNSLPEMTCRVGIQMWTLLSKDLYTLMNG